MMIRSTSRRALVRRAAVAVAGTLVALVSAATVPPAQAADPADSPPSLVESFDYPGADGIQQQQGIALHRGDGRITLAACTGLAGLVSVDTFAGRYCFKVTGPTGYLALDLPDPYSIRGDDHTVTAIVSDDGVSENVAVTKNAWTPVGVSTHPDATSSSLLELRATAGPATPAAPPAANPFLVRIETGTDQACSGALVANRWVLTARACFAFGGSAATTGPPTRPTNAVIGRADLTQPGGQSVAVDLVVPHPDRDLLLARLATPVDGIAPVRVATAAPAPGEVLQAAGWGRTATEWVPARPHVRPLSAGAVDGPTFTVNGPTPEPVACKGDGGGPLFRPTPTGPELVALHSTAGQAGCVAETGTVRDATEVRVDDLQSWLANPGIELAGNPTATSTELALATGPLVPAAPAGIVVGRPAAVTLSPGSTPDPLGYLVNIGTGSGTPSTLWANAGPDGKAVIPVAPPVAGESYVSFAVRSGNGSTSPTVSYRFQGNAPAAPPNPAPADPTGDGRSEVVHTRNVGGWMTVWSAAATADGGWFPNVQLYDGRDRFAATGTRLADGDFNGDGRSDLAALRQVEPGRVDLAVLVSDGNAFQGTNVLWDSGAGAGWDLADLTATAADVTGDGRADLVVYRPDGTGGTEMLVLAATGTGTAVTVSPPASWGVIPAPSMPNREIVRTGDVNGDGKADLVRVADEGGQTVVWVHTSTGNAFDIGTRWYESGSGTFDFDRLRVVVADVAGSPAADVAVVHGHEPGVTGITALVSDGSRLTAGPVWNAPAGALDTGGLWVTGADVAGDDHVDLITVVDSLDGHTAASAHIATDSTFTAPTAVWDSGQREWTTLSVGGLGPVPNLTSAAELSSSSNAPDGEGFALANLTNRMNGATSGWSSAATTTNHTEWVQLAFPLRRLINRVVLYPRLDAGHVGEGFPANFTIDVWTGTEWATVVRRAGFANPGSAPVAFTFPVQSTDQLRIQGTDLSVMQLSELEAYQTAVAHDRDNLPIPTTTTTSTTTTTTAPPPPPPPPDPCHGPSSTPSFQSRVNLFTTAPARSGPYNGCASVGQSYTYSNPQWVWCRVWSDEVNDGNGNWNSYWLWTALDTGGMGWIPAYYTADEGNNQAFDIYTGRQIPDCGY